MSVSQISDYHRRFYHVRIEGGIKSMKRMIEKDKEQIIILIVFVGVFYIAGMLTQIIGGQT